MTNDPHTPDPVEEMVNDFEEQFTRWVVLGSTLNDGSEIRFNRKPEMAIDWLRTTLTKVAEEARREERYRIEKQLRPLRTTDKRKYDVVLWRDVLTVLSDK